MRSLRRWRWLLISCLLGCESADQAGAGPEMLGSQSATGSDVPGAPNGSGLGAPGAASSEGMGPGTTGTPSADGMGTGDVAPSETTAPGVEPPVPSVSQTGGSAGFGGSTTMSATGGGSGGGGEQNRAGGSGGMGAGGATSGTGGAPMAGAGGMQGDAPSPRTECPDAPPSEQKDPATDRNLAVQKDQYAALMTKEEPFVGTRGTLPWHLYTPDQVAAAPDELFPLLVVLHGGYGREVEDGNIMVDVAPYLLGSANGLLIDANRDAYPTYIVAPHCRLEDGCEFTTNEWAATSGGAHFDVLEEPSVAGGTALELIRHVIDEYQVDPTRVYLTGNSMGGGGSWSFSQRHPELFAAVVPVSGHMPRLDLLDAIVDAMLPVWAFGAVNDNSNPYADTVEAIDYIDAAGGCAWLTSYNNAGHDDALWSSPYLEAGLWPWLFAQTNPSAPR